MPVIMDSNKYAFSFESQHIGRIRVWPATSISAVSALLDTPRKKTPPRESMLFLLSLTAAPENFESPREKGEFLSKDRLAALSDDELEKLAGEFLTHHTYLFEDARGFTLEAASDESDLDEVKSGSVDLPRREQESNVDYLRRLVEDYCKTQNEAMQKAIASFSESLSKFAPDFSALTLMNSNIGDSISKAIDSMHSGFLVGKDMSLLASPILPPPNPHHTTNNILADIEDILFQQKDINVETANHIQQLSMSAQMWETEAKKSTRLTWLSIWIAFVAALAAILALIVAYLTYRATPIP